MQEEEIHKVLDLIGFPRAGSFEVERGHVVRIVQYLLLQAPAPAPAPSKPAGPPLYYPPGVRGGPSPLVGDNSTPAPPSLDAVPVSPLLPQGVIFGRVPKGAGPGPVAVQGPPPPHVQIGPSIPSGARVSISGGGTSEGYAGDLQPGQIRVEITGPDGRPIAPPIYKNADGTIRGVETAAPLIPQPSALVNPPAPVVAAAAAPGSLADTFGARVGAESVRLASMISGSVLAALDRFVQGDPLEGEAVREALILSGILEESGGRLELSQVGREALAIARNRKAGGPS